MNVRLHGITAPDGVRLHVRDYGNAAGPPLLLLHGWSQSGLCWRHQVDGELARDFRLVCPDLRGHGQSDRPLGAACYQGAAVWARDVAAVMQALALERPLLVGWSYGSLVAGLYVQEFGDAALAGLQFVGGACRVGPAEVGRLLGPVFADVLPRVTGEDLAENILGMRRFLDACFVAPLSREERETALAWNMVVAPQVRNALLGWSIDTTAALGRLTKPLLVSHGRADAVTLPAMAELILASAPTARASWYAGVGHAPFLEAPARFNAELAAFARELRA
ncbi:MAG: alpha/beta fold hydrolase [Gammaproteobacteria bacterium]